MTASQSAAATFGALRSRIRRSWSPVPALGGTTFDDASSAHALSRCTLPGQHRVHALYNGPTVQSAITVTIMVNFMASAAKAQIMYRDGKPVNEGTKLDSFFWSSELIFAIVFVIDMLVNLYGHFGLRFFRDPWNVFDCAVIVVTLLSQFKPDMPAMSVLRLFRAFRAFRLFKRIPELHAIMAASLRSLPSVSHAFLILGLVMGIWSIMAVEFWTEEGFCASLGEFLVDDEICMDMFGQFTLAMLTMFQVTTFDSWSSGVTRPMVLSAEKASTQIAIGVFFVLYQFISAIIVMNVVVAILLDKFLSAPEEIPVKQLEEETEKAERLKAMQEHSNPEATTRRLTALVGKVSLLVKALELEHVHVAELQKLVPGEREPCASEIENEPATPISSEVSETPNLLDVGGLIFDLPSSTSFHELEAWVKRLQCNIRGHLSRVRVRRLRSRRMEADAVMDDPSRSPAPLHEQVYQMMEESAIAGCCVRSHRWTTRLKLPRQDAVLHFYESRPSQITVATFIFLNFFFSAIKAEMNPLTDGQANFFFILEATFGFLFAAELVINLYGSFCSRFWMNPWNIFDFVIVAVSILAVMYPNLPGVSVLRLFRAFRAFRLFKRMKGLRNIFVGVLKSLPRVSYAFVILVLIMGIWSIIAVELFGADFPDFFGNFFLSMLSLFQVMTYDSWTSQIARPVIVCKKEESPWLGIAAAIFFASYAFFASIFMMNVVVAILIDKFLESAAEEKLAEEAARCSSIDDAGRIQKNKILGVEAQVQTELIKLRDRLRRVAAKAAVVTGVPQRDATSSAIRLVRSLTSHCAH